MCIFRLRQLFLQDSIESSTRCEVKLESTCIIYGCHVISNTLDNLIAWPKPVDAALATLDKEITPPLWRINPHQTTGLCLGRNSPRFHRRYHYTIHDFYRPLRPTCREKHRLHFPERQTRIQSKSMLRVRSSGLDLQIRSSILTMPCRNLDYMRVTGTKSCLPWSVRKMTGKYDHVG